MRFATLSPLASTCHENIVVSTWDPHTHVCFRYFKPSGLRFVENNTVVSARGPQNKFVFAIFGKPGMRLGTQIEIHLKSVRIASLINFSQKSNRVATLIDIDPKSIRV